MTTTPPIGRGKNWHGYFQFDEEKETSTEIRNILLVIFTLIAAVTFQAGVNPPGVVWQDERGHIAGTAIYSSQKKFYYIFLIFYTLAFSYSIMVILSLTHQFPFHFELWVATIAMAITYVPAILAVTPKEAVKFRFILLVAVETFVTRLGIHCFHVVTGNL